MTFFRAIKQRKLRAEGALKPLNAADKSRCALEEKAVICYNPMMYEYGQKGIVVKRYGKAGKL